MRKTAFGITLLLLYGVTFAQESAKIVEVPQVSIKDSLFYQMIYSVVNDAKECPTTALLSSGIICKKHELQNVELYDFLIEPFDDLILFIESLHGTNSWRITTINDMSILFFFSDSNKFTVMDTSQIIINTRQRIKYEYIMCKDTIDISEQSPKSLCMREEYSREKGRYLLQYRSPCINIKESKKIIKTNGRVLYFFKE